MSGSLGGGQAAGRHHAERAADPVARGRSRPSSGWSPRRRSAQVTRVSNWMSRRRSKRSATWLSVAQDLRLGGVALGPVPFLLQLRREGVGIVAGSRRRSARRDSGSSTRCRRRRRPARRPGRKSRGRAAGAACTGRRTRRRRSPPRWFRRGRPCRLRPWSSSRTSRCSPGLSWHSGFSLGGKATHSTPCCQRPPAGAARPGIANDWLSGRLPLNQESPAMLDASTQWSRCG